MLDFSDTERAAVYRAISLRRDVRAEFLDAPVDDDVLLRILGAAHRAPSVGLSQPWRFIVVRDAATRGAMSAAFDRANEDAHATYTPETAAAYATLKLSGLHAAPVHICVTCNESPIRGRNLGRRTMPEMARYSTVCAIQNLWLAARVEGIGVGWISIIDPSIVRETLAIPAEIALVAYLALGHVNAFAPQADLERDGWERRVPVAEVIDYERFGAPQGVRP